MMAKLFCYVYLLLAAFCSLPFMSKIICLQLAVDTAFFYKPPSSRTTTDILYRFLVISFNGILLSTDVLLSFAIDFRPSATRLFSFAMGNLSSSEFINDRI